jgi:hypothetical protein
LPANSSWCKLYRDDTDLGNASMFLLCFDHWLDSDSDIGDQTFRNDENDYERICLHIVRLDAKQLLWFNIFIYRLKLRKMEFNPNWTSGMV